MSRIKKTSEYKYGRATAKVYRPDLTEKERERFEEKIIFAMKQILKGER